MHTSVRLRLYAPTCALGLLALSGCASVPVVQPCQRPEPPASLMVPPADLSPDRLRAILGRT